MNEMSAERMMPENIFNHDQPIENAQQQQAGSDQPTVKVVGKNKSRINSVPQLASTKKEIDDDFNYGLEQRKIETNQQQPPNKISSTSNIVTLKANKNQMVEPDIFMGHTLVAGVMKPCFLPIDTVIQHSFGIGRSKGGKSHTTAILSLGLSKTAACRRANLTAAFTQKYRNNNNKTKYEPSQTTRLLGLTGLLPSRPPLSICLFDPHSDLAMRLLEDLARQITFVRLQRWLTILRTGFNLTDKEIEIYFASNSLEAIHWDLTPKKYTLSPLPKLLPEKSTAPENAPNSSNKGIPVIHYGENAGYQYHRNSIFNQIENNAKNTQPIFRLNKPIITDTTVEEGALPNWEDVLEKMVIYVNLADRKNPFGLNLLDTEMWENKEDCAAAIIEIFHRIYVDSWGTRMEDLLRHAIYALYLLNKVRLPNKQFTILDLVSFIRIASWRDELLANPVIAKQNPEIAAWWHLQFDSMSDNFRGEVEKPVLTKLNVFISSDLLKNIFGQPQTTINFEKILPYGNIVLMDLAARTVSKENCALIGAILIGVLLKKVGKIADQIPNEADRPVVQLIVDEIANILAAPYGEITSEFRKFGVRSLLLTQSTTYLDKLDPNLRPLIMANCANLMVLQVNAEDADKLREELVADSTKSGYANLAATTYRVNPSAGSGGNIGPDKYDLVNARRGLCYFKGTFKNVREPVFTIQIAPRPFSKEVIERTFLPNTAKIFEQEFERVLTNLRKTSIDHYTSDGGEMHARNVQKSLDYSSIENAQWDSLYYNPLTQENISELINGFTDSNWQRTLEESLLKHRSVYEEKKAREQRGYNQSRRSRRNNSNNDDENEAAKEGGSRNKGKNIETSKDGGGKKKQQKGQSAKNQEKASNSNSKLDPTASRKNNGNDNSEKVKNGYYQEKKKLSSVETLEEAGIPNEHYYTRNGKDVRVPDSLGHSEFAPDYEGPLGYRSSGLNNDPNYTGSVPQHTQVSPSQRAFEGVNLHDGKSYLARDLVAKKHNEEKAAEKKRLETLIKSEQAREEGRRIAAEHQPHQQLTLIEVPSNLEGTEKQKTETSQKTGSSNADDKNTTKSDKKSSKPKQAVDVLFDSLNPANRLSNQKLK